jgi:hypothetical protein
MKMLIHKYKFTQMVRFLNSINKTNLILTIFSFMYHLVFEIWKISTGAEFYYGGHGTSYFDLLEKQDQYNH